MKKQLSGLISVSLILSALLSIGACSNRIQITEYPTHHQDELAAFSSYCWAENSSQENPLIKVDPTGGHNKLFDQNIRDTINEDLGEKGYRQTACASANFMIDYRMGWHEDVAAVDATQSDTTTNPYGPRWSIGDDKSVNYQGLVEPKEQIITVRHGTIHIAAFSTTTNILWHSSAEKMLNDQDTDETRRATIKTAVQKIMAGFPAKHP